MRRPGVPRFVAIFGAIALCSAFGGVAAADLDGDGVPNHLDNCPSTPNGPDQGTCVGGPAQGALCLNPEECGGGFCDVWQTDSDGDGVGDVCEDDFDADGVPDVSDNCPTTPNGPNQGTCVGGPGHGELCLNPEVCGGGGFCDDFQSDRDEDGVGDACEDDVDADGVRNDDDNCPFTANGPSLGSCVDHPIQRCSSAADCATDEICSNNQEDRDVDQLGDVCDACPDDADNDADGDGVCGNADNCPDDWNPDQTNTDRAEENLPGRPPGDDLGDVCDPDIDNDGYCNPGETALDCSGQDNCPVDWNPNQRDADGDGVGDPCDNCVRERNPDQQDRDGDERGDACDPCPDDYDPVWEDRDGDRITDVCDNCPDHSNDAQDDRDRDGTGDACDCSDGWMGENERGADCGDFCSASCPTRCVPVAYNGHPDDKIDVLFIPSDESRYDTSITEEWPSRQFLADVREAIEDAYFADPVIDERREALNFWYLRRSASISAGNNSVDLCVRNSIPEWEEFCPHVHFAAVLHEVACRDFSLGNVVTSEFDSPGTLLHESGHALFRLADEYDDAPDCLTGYFPSRRFQTYPHNIFRKKERCENKTNNDPAGCVEFTTCLDSEDRSYEENAWPGTPADGWWKAQPPDTIMSCTCLNSVGNSFPAAICPWGPDGSPAVTHFLNIHLWGSASGLRAGTLPAIDPRVVVITLHYDGESLSMRRSTLVPGTPPNRYLEFDAWIFRVRDSGGSEVYGFSAIDPRYVDFDFPPGAAWRDSVEFKIVVPFFEQMRTLEVTRLEVGEDGQSREVSVGDLDLVKGIREFCSDNPNDPACGSYDPDGDGFPDVEDNCPDEANPDQNDQDDDGPGDWCDCEPNDADVYPGAQEINDGRDNQCPGDPGYGAVDEISGDCRVEADDEGVSFSWPAQADASMYQLVRATTPDLSAECVLVSTPEPGWTDPEVPEPGEVFHYVLRPLAERRGSWGRASNGVERGIACADSVNLLTFTDTIEDDLPADALYDFFAEIQPQPQDWLFFEIRHPMGPNAWCAERADFYRDSYLNWSPVGGGASAGPWEKWYRHWTFNEWFNTFGTHTNAFGGACWGPYSWCSESGLGNQPGRTINPGAVTLHCELYDVSFTGCGDGTWSFTLRTAKDMQTACGFAVVPARSLRQGGHLFTHIP